MATRADNSEGSCRQVKTGRHNGKWRVQYSLTDELGRTKRLSKLFDRQAEGKAFLRETKRGVAIGEVVRSRELTLGAWFDWLLENDFPESLDEKTILGRQHRFNKFVRPVFGNVPLTKVDPMVVRAFYRELKQDGVGSPTILETKRDLVRVFNLAVAPYQRVPMTWANPFKLKVETPERRDAVTLTPTHARQSLASRKLSSERRAMLALFLLSGVRLSEQMAMTRGQLLFDQDLILIDKAIKFSATGQQSIGLPKRDKIRLAVMCPTLKRLLLSVVARMAEDDVIWPAATENKARMKKLVYATWREIIKQVGLPPETTIQDCRLSHNNWVEKLMPDVSPTTRKEHIGHAASGVGEVHYSRPISPAQKVLRDEIERIVGLPISE